MGEMRAIKSELKEARTELLLARLSLKEVSERLGAGASAAGVSSAGSRVRRRAAHHHRRLLGAGGLSPAAEGAAAKGVGNGSTPHARDGDVNDAV